jgi:hypothetical protein
MLKLTNYYIETKTDDTLFKFLCIKKIRPPIQRVLGVLSLWIKWLGCEADHSPLTTVEAKKTRVYTSIPYTHFHEIVLN